MAVPLETSSRTVPQMLAHMAAQKIDFSIPVDEGTLQDKSVLITGGANGLGASCQRAFIEAGAQVTIADDDADSGVRLENEAIEEDYESVAEVLPPSNRHQAENISCRFVETNVLSWSSQINAFKTAIQFSRHKSIDVVIMAACFTAKLAFHYFCVPSKDGVQRWKSLILMGSLGGYIDMRNMVDHGSASFGIRGLFRGLRSLGEAREVAVNLVAPTYILQQMPGDVIAQVAAAGIEFCRIDAVVNTILRLSSDLPISGTFQPSELVFSLLTKSLQAEPSL
ncbi:MAG: hypothetical protein M1837_002110 [Sclerophora amabilis]|nr:MAG: hypothetical protein M1837_002110 [Sclerophora amabilis]